MSPYIVLNAEVWKAKGGIAFLERWLRGQVFVLPEE